MGGFDSSAYLSVKETQYSLDSLLGNVTDCPVAK